MPFTLNTTMFIVIVAVFQMSLGISGATRHGSQSQHNPTLTLFEIRVQRLVSRHPADGTHRHWNLESALCNSSWHSG
jgi:hypothetical protein